MTGPLAGVRVVELGGIGPGPYAGMLLADLGAEVIRIDRPELAGRSSEHPILHRGRRSVVADLKDPADAERVRGLIADAAGVIEGFRPGVAERLGLGPDDCLAVNPALVYGRITGWGQDGPLAQVPGHDINYIAIAGVLGAMGPADEVPPVPLNLAGDMGGGLLLALGMCAALVHARATGEGQVVDAAMTDAAASQLSLILGLVPRGMWQDRRESNLFDGAAPFYRTYRCADGLFVAIGAVEPQFFAALREGLGLADDPAFDAQFDAATWPAMAETLERAFLKCSRDEWVAHFDGVEACVSPVLSFAEAAQHPHNLARGTYLPGDTPAPAPAPRFSRTPLETPPPAPRVGADTDAVMPR